MASAAVLLLIAGGCGSDDPPKGRPLVDPPPLQPINLADLTADKTVAPAAQAITAFGYRLYQESAAANANAVLSPLSIVTAFGMARAGAAGETAAEFDRVFGFPAEGPHPALSKLIRAIDTTPGAPPKPAKRRPGDPPADPIVSIANGLFVQEGTTLKDPFTRIVGQQYAAQARAVDFGGPDATRAIDAWVREQTAGKIQKLFDQLDPSTKVVLANAVYLKADWKTPFGETPTSDAPFTRADGSQVTVKMMRQFASLRYATGPGWQAVELPYAGDTLAMWIMLPTGSGSPTGLLSPATLSAVAAGLQPASVDLSLPRWDFAASLDLLQQLSKLGLHAGGDFSGMADGVFLSQAVHRASITVDELGTEAAAATGTAFATSGHGGVDITFRADHPFAFAIVHSPTNTPLFIGHVADPSKR